MSPSEGMGLSGAMDRLHLREDKYELFYFFVFLLFYENTSNLMEQSRRRKNVTEVFLNKILEPNLLQKMYFRFNLYYFESERWNIQSRLSIGKTS